MHIRETAIRMHNSIRFYRPLILICSLLIIIVAGCGTAHRFVPAQPLEKGKWQINVSWHYDINGLAIGKSFIMPEVNSFVGLTDDLIGGFGLTAPMFLDHLSLAAYSEQSENDYLIVWSHFEWISPYDNPLVDIGAAFSTKREDISQMVAVGIGLGHSGQWPIGDYTSPSRRLTGPSVSLKYSVRNKNFGVGLVRRHGKTVTRLKAMFPVWPPTNDTILNLAAGEAIEIVELEEDPLGSTRLESVRGVVLQSGDTVIVGGNYRRYPDAIWQPLVALEEWTGEELAVLWIQKRWVIADFSSIERAVARGEPVVVTRAPREIVDRIEHLNPWLSDNSLGLCVFGRPD